MCLLLELGVDERDGGTRASGVQAADRVLRSGD